MSSIRVDLEMIDRIQNDTRVARKFIETTVTIKLSKFKAIFSLVTHKFENDHFLF